MAGRRTEGRSTTCLAKRPRRCSSHLAEGCSPRRIAAFSRRPQNQAKFPCLSAFWTPALHGPQVFSGPTATSDLEQWLAAAVPSACAPGAQVTLVGDVASEYGHVVRNGSEGDGGIMDGDKTRVQDVPDITRGAADLQVRRVSFGTWIGTQRCRWCRLDRQPPSVCLRGCSGMLRRGTSASPSCGATRGALRARSLSSTTSRSASSRRSLLRATSPSQVTLRGQANPDGCVW